jgi:hypothetical protein
MKFTTKGLAPMTTNLLRMGWLVTMSLCLQLNAGASEKDLALAAEQAGNLREAVTHYAKAFRELPWTDGAKDDLEAKIVALAAKLDPPPAISEEAERRMARGRRALKSATTPSDYADAANEFLAAINEAPWCPEAHFNLGVVREKQGEYARAISSFKRYLAANPRAEDAKAVKGRIYELEFEAEKAAKVANTKAAEERMQSRQAELLVSLAGTWTDRDGSQRFEATVQDREIELRWSQFHVPTGWHPVEAGRLRLRGRIEGQSIKGTAFIDETTHFRNGIRVERDLTGTISPDGRSMHLEYVGIFANGASGDVANGFIDTKATWDLVRP